MNKNDKLHWSRRDFARAAALGTAALALPADVLAQQQKPAPEAAKAPAVKSEDAEMPKLSAASQAEADASYDLLIRKYGTRFTDAQKADLKRLVYQQQQGLDKVRAFDVTNADQPATVFQPEVKK